MQDTTIRANVILDGVGVGFWDFKSCPRAGELFKAALLRSGEDKTYRVVSIVHRPSDATQAGALHDLDLVAELQ